MDKLKVGLLVFLLFWLLILIFGCTQKTMEVTLPHSGENISLFISEENFKSGIITAERNEGDVHVRYHREWTAGYSHHPVSKTDISYSDADIEYSVKIEGYAQFTGPSAESVYYNCTRGNCGFPFVFELSARCFAGGYYIDANCSNSTYSVFFKQGYIKNASFLGKKFEGSGCPIFKTDDCEKILKILNLSLN